MDQDIQTEFNSVKSEIRSLEVKIDHVKSDTQILNKFMFGNGVKGLVQSMGELAEAVSSIKVSEQAIANYVAGCRDHDTVKDSSRIVKLKTIGIWLAGVSLVANVVLSMLGVI